jgi:hypothetical protein
LHRPLPDRGADSGKEGVLTQPSDDQLRRYVLRQLPDAEAEAIEAAYFDDSALAARVDDADDDLARAYVDGTLEPADRAAFERSLDVPGRAARVAFIGGITAAAAQSRGSALPMPPAMRSPGTAWTALAAAAVLLLAVGGWWLLAPIPPATPAPQADAQPPGPAPTVPAAPATAPDVVVALALPVTATRSGGAAPTIELPGDATVVLLRLAVPVPSLSDLTADVRGVDNGRQWRGVPTPPAPDAPAATTAEVRVPAAELPAGDYILTVRRGDQPVTTAFFRVVRR